MSRRLTGLRHKFFVAGAVSCCLLLANPVAAVVATVADDVCAAEADPCNINFEVDVVDGSTLDFGLRRLNLTNGARFDFQSGSGRIVCGQLDVDVSGGFVNASGPISPTESSGGLVQLEARRGCELDSDRPCLRPNDCLVGSCSVRRCEANAAQSCSTNADCGGTCATNACTNKPSLACATNVDCDVGPCPSTLSCSAAPDLTCESNLDCDLGMCSEGTGTMSLSGRINGNATEPAVVIILAVGDISFSKSVNINGLGVESDGGEFSVDSLDGSITIDTTVSVTGGSESQGGEIALSADQDVIINDKLDANGGDFDGGVFEIFAGNDYVQDASLLANATAGEGFGGEAVIDARRDLTVVAGSQNNRNRIATEGHTGAEFFGGDGGTQELTAGRDMSLGTFTRFEGNGALPDGRGADLFVGAGRDFFLDGEIEARSLGGQGAGGFIQVDTEGDLEIGPNGNIDLFGGSTGGGDCEILSDGDFTHRGLVDVSAGSDGPGGSIEIDSGSDVHLMGTLSGSGADGASSGGQIRIDACRIALASTGVIDNAIDGGANTLIVRESAVLSAGSELLARGNGGSNTLIHRDPNKPPTLAGTATPAVTVLINEDLVGCPICGNSEIDQGEHCDDGNSVGGDGCSAGCLDEGCIADTPDFPVVDLCDDGIACTADSCNVGTSSCDHEFLCDDGVACTVDACVEDACQNTPDDGACDDVDVCTDNVCVDLSGCTFPTNTESCDDGLFCTVDDVCDAGTCGGSGRDCSDGVTCTVDSCDDDADECVSTPDDGACSDGDFCDGDEVCDIDNDCVEGVAVDCSGLDETCLLGVCDEVGDACSTDSANESGVCDDGVASTENDQCINGFCVGEDIDCSDGIPCTIDSFSEELEACENIPNDPLCDNGDFCDGAETCSADSGCLIAAVVDCSGLDDQCLAGVCDEGSNACVAQSANEAGSCDDGAFCTVSDTCESGSCVGSVRDCDDGVGCSIDSCDEELDSCIATTDNASCDDGLFCNGVEICDAVDDCQMGTAPDCSGLDDGVCVAGTCDEDGDACAEAPTREGETCDDNAFCTEDDQCTLGVCVGTARDCSDGVACTTDACDETTDECVWGPQDSFCDDSLFCNGTETCDTANDCQSGVALDCSGLDDECALGTCDESVDKCAAEPANEGNVCDDGDFCTDGDTCTSGTCSGTLRDNCLVCG
ncbi:MAG: hypothetical protein ACI8TX_002868, partial [Hyphomicrobiaceae bacterium]